MSDMFGAGAVGAASIQALQSMINMNWQNAWANSQAKKQQAYNAAMQAQAQNYTTWLSSTAYQRAVQDMKLAGINPMLAYQQGGASANSASGAASSSIPHGANVSASSDFANALSNGVRAMLGSYQKDNLQSNTALQAAQIKKELTQAELNSDTAAQVRVQTVTEAERPGLTRDQATAARAAAGLSDAASATEVARRRQIEQQTRDAERYGQPGMGPAQAGQAGARAAQGSFNIGTAIGDSIRENLPSAAANLGSAARAVRRHLDSGIDAIRRGLRNLDDSTGFRIEGRRPD